MARKYQNPVIMFDPTFWSDRNQLRFMRFNILVNRILPERLLWILNASKASREWRRKESQRTVKKAEKSK